MTFSSKPGSSALSTSRPSSRRCRPAAPIAGGRALPGWSCRCAKRDSNARLRRSWAPRAHRKGSFDSHTAMAGYLLETWAVRSFPCAATGSPAGIVRKDELSAARRELHGRGRALDLARESLSANGSCPSFWMLRFSAGRRRPGRTPPGPARLTASVQVSLTPRPARSRLRDRAELDDPSMSWRSRRRKSRRRRCG